MPENQGPKIEADWSSNDESENSESEIIYELTSDDGFKASSNDINKLWLQVFDAVSEARMLHGLSPLENNPMGEIGLQMLGLTHSAIQYLVEQLPGAREVAEKYQFKHHHKGEELIKLEVLGTESTISTGRLLLIEIQLGYVFISTSINFSWFMDYIACVFNFYSSWN